MIYIGKAPYRISLLGGGSDLDWFVAEHGHGLTLGFSIDKYSTVVISPRPKSSDNRGILNYSSREEFIDVHSISHPLIRSTFLRLGIKNPLEMSSFGEAAGGSGLGGSSSFLIALISAITQMQGVSLTQSQIASIACTIEIQDLSKPIGRQDQYLSAIGGFNALRFLADRSVHTIDIASSLSTLTTYVESLVLVSTSITRSASLVLSAMQSNSSTTASTLLELRAIAENFVSTCLNDILSPAELASALEDAMLHSWKLKKSLPSVMNSSLSDLESFLSSSGFLVLKLLGAGGGGYFLCKPLHGMSSFESLNSHGLAFSRVSLSSTGSQSWTI